MVLVHSLGRTTLFKEYAINTEWGVKHWGSTYSDDMCCPSLMKIPKKHHFSTGTNADGTRYVPPLANKA